MRIALLSQEGSVIAFFAMTRGVVPHKKVSECILSELGSGTTLDGCALSGLHSLRSSPRTISTAVSIVLPS
jgi:hypothetical protein